MNRWPQEARRRSGGSVGGGAWRAGSSLSRSAVAFRTRCTALSTACSVRADVDCTPLTLRTNWRAAASISSAVASGCKPRRVVMLRHMARGYRPLRGLVGGLVVAAQRLLLAGQPADAALGPPLGLVPGDMHPDGGQQRREVA